MASEIEAAKAKVNTVFVVSSTDTTLTFNRPLVQGDFYSYVNGDTGKLYVFEFESTV